MFGCLIICCSQIIVGQNKYTVYAESGGTGLFQTVNMEKVIDKPSRSASLKAIRLGVGISPKYVQYPALDNEVKKGKGLALVLVAGYNFFGNWGLSGVNPNHFELGINAVFVTKNSLIEKIGNYKDKFRAFPSLNIGFRHQPIDAKGILWRISYCPFYITEGVKHWLGASIGYAF